VLDPADMREHGHQDRGSAEEQRDGRRSCEPERVDEGELVQPDADCRGGQHESHVRLPYAKAPLAAKRDAAEDERGKRVAWRGERKRRESTERVLGDREVEAPDEHRAEEQQFSASVRRQVRPS